MELLNYYNNTFYMNTNILKDSKNKYIEGKAKDLIKHLKFTLPHLYLSYANDNLDIEELEHIQQEYFTIIEELEKLDANDIVKVCENEMMESLFIEKEKEGYKMEINNKKVVGNSFAYDGCHKIYILEDEEDKKEAIEGNYKIYNIDKLEFIYNKSCSLKFIYNWKLNKFYVGQGEEAYFKY